MPDYWTVNQENLAEHFDQSFWRGKIGKLLDKKIARTARRQLNGRHLLFGEYYFAVLNNPLSLKLADIFPRERFNELRLASFRLLPFIFTPRPTPSYASPYLLSQRIRQVPHIQKKSGQDHCVNRAISQALLRASYFLFIDNNNNYYNHNYKKILRSDWLSTVLISSLLGQLNRTVRVMLK